MCFCIHCTVFYPYFPVYESDGVPNCKAYQPCDDKPCGNLTCTNDNTKSRGNICIKECPLTMVEVTNKSVALLLNSTTLLWGDHQISDANNEGGSQNQISKDLRIDIWQSVVQKNLPLPHLTRMYIKPHSGKEYHMSLGHICWISNELRLIFITHFNPLQALFCVFLSHFSTKSKHFLLIMLMTSTEQVYHTPGTRPTLCLTCLVRGQIRDTNRLSVVIVSLININSWPYMRINNFQLTDQTRSML